MTVTLSAALIASAVRPTAAICRMLRLLHAGLTQPFPTLLSAPFLSSSVPLRPETVMVAPLGVVAHRTPAQ